MLKKPKIVVIGGGTGTSMLLRGLKDYPISLSAIITTADTGGSSGRLRKEVGMVPPGDARQCLVALNEGSHPILEHFNTRFGGGSLRGHTFGNLFLALLWQNYGDFQKAIEEAENLFKAKHSIIPVTTGPTNLVAHVTGRKQVEGEANIIKVRNLHKRLKKLELVPRANINPKAKKAIEKADYIIIGPGNLFASLTPPLLARGMKKTIKESSAKKIYIANLMNQKRLVKDFSLEDYIGHFTKVLGKDVFDHVVYNNARIDPGILKEFKIKDEPLIPQTKDPRLVGANLINTRIKKQDPNDPLTRTIIRHDSKKLAKAVWKIIES